MAGTRYLGFSLLIVAAACTPKTTSQAPKPLKPQDGPQASLFVSYTGGLLDRNVRAYFRAEQYAYVMVGHLGGDGRIRVLFPESPDESGFIRGKKQYVTMSTPAYYDAIPSLFSFTMSRFRGLGAMHDSYDGRGHGYVFMIASRTPLKYELLYDYAGWAELEMEDYEQHYDPRYAVRSFAEALAGGAKYTLKFANSMMSQGYTSYASRAWDCSVLNSLGTFANAALWNTFQPSWFGYRSYSSYCGGTTFPRFASGPVFTTVVQRPPTIPAGDPAPSLDRPTRRGLGARELPTRTTLTRVAPSVPRDPTNGRESIDRRTRRPYYGATRNTGRTESTGVAGSSRPSASRNEGSRVSSPRSGETRSSGSPSGGSTSTSTPSSSGSSSGTRSGDRPAVSSPRSGGSRSPEQQP